MAVKSAYLVKVALIYLLTIADLLINATADHHDFPQAMEWYPFAFIGMQYLIQLLNLLMVFMLFFGTYLFQVGLIGVLLKEFKGSLYIMPLYTAVYIAYSGCKLVRDGGRAERVCSMRERLGNGKDAGAVTLSLLLLRSRCLSFLLLQNLLMQEHRSQEELWIDPLFIFLAIAQKLGEHSSKRGEKRDG